jgi:uroporphyrinogen-III synthase
LSKVKISALVRGEDKAAVLNQLGIQPIVVPDYDDLETFRKAARENDGESIYVHEYPILNFISFSLLL